MTDTNEHAARLDVIDEAHRGVNGGIDGVHLSLAHQHAIREKRETGPWTGVDADHQSLRRCLELP
ncbi:MAG: hypothetical protein CL980_00405 [Euryarchaeota archaeon]|nr:hypothetical protein [Euryarchaeota archaeon]